MNQEEKEEIIKQLIEVLVKELDGEIHYYWCSDKYTKGKKIEIIYDRKKR
jgi:hypothetical protein